MCKLCNRFVHESAWIVRVLAVSGRDKSIFGDYAHTHRGIYLLYMHAYIHTYIQTNKQTNKHTYIYVQTYIHTYIHTYMNTYIHTYIKSCANE